MTWDEYERHVLGQLCWICHEATRPSHRQQRRCPRCLRKWSFHDRRLNCELLKAFALDASARHASRVINCSYPLAHAMFAECRAELVKLVRKEQQAAIKEIGLRTKGKGQQLLVFEWNERVHCMANTGFAGAVPCRSALVIGIDVTKGLQGARVVPQNAGPRGTNRSRMARIGAFWQTAVNRIVRQARGVGTGQLAAYLAEAEYRFNHTDDSIIELLHPRLSRMCVPA